MNKSRWIPLEIKTGNSKLTKKQRNYQKNHKDYIVERVNPFPVWY